jgi:hypothetical protein
MKPELRRTLYIGLGGTGAMALRLLKKRYLEVYGHIDMENHSLPEFVKFIVFDTDRDAQLSSDNRVTAYNPFAGGNNKGKALTVNFDPSEVIGVHAENCRNAIQNQTNKKMFEGWFPLSNNEIINHLTDLKKGAGQIRLFGRVAFFFNADRIRKVISDSINQIMSVNQANSFFDPKNNDLDIYLVGSLAGGTGSGMFMDTAMMCRDIVTSGTNTLDVKIRGYFVLPEVFLNARIGTPNDFPRIFPNAAGALKELDLFTEFLDGGDVKAKQNGGNYSLKEQVWNPERSPINEVPDKKDLTIRYLGGEYVTLSKRPFDAVYLVGQSNTASYTINSLDDISEYLAKALFSLSGAVAAKLASMDDNTKNADNELFNGKVPWVGGIGVSELVYNSYEVRKHLALRAIEQSLSFALSDETDSSHINVSVQRFMEDNKLVEAGDTMNVVFSLMSETTPISVELDPEEYEVPENKLNDKRALSKQQFQGMGTIAQKMISEVQNNLNYLKSQLPEKGTVKAEIRIIEEIQKRLSQSIEELRKDSELDSLRAQDLDAQRITIQNEMKDFLSMNAAMRWLKKSELRELVNNWCEISRNLLNTEQLQEARRLGLELLSNLQIRLSDEKNKEENEARWFQRLLEDVRSEIAIREYGSIASEFPNAFTVNHHVDEMKQNQDIFSDQAWNQDAFIGYLTTGCSQSVKNGITVESLWGSLNIEIIDYILGVGLSTTSSIKEDKLEIMLTEGLKEAEMHTQVKESKLGKTFTKLLEKSLPLINYSNSSKYFNGKNETLKASLRHIFYISIPSKDEGLKPSLEGFLNKLKSDDAIYQFNVLPSPDQLDRVTIFRRLLALPVYELSGIRVYLNDYDKTHTKDLKTGMVYHTNYNWYQAMKQIDYNLLEGSLESSNNKLKLFVWSLLMGWIKWEGEFWRIVTNDSNLKHTWKLRRDELFTELMMEGNYSKEVEMFLQKKMSSVAELKDAFNLNVSKNDLSYDFSGYLGNKSINPYAGSITPEDRFGSSYKSLQGGPSARIQLEAELEILKEIAEEIKSW